MNPIPCAAPGAATAQSQSLVHEERGLGLGFLKASATMSSCGRYRYELFRQWGEGRTFATFIMLNPSTADAFQDDPTIRRCVGFAKAWECDGLTVLNLFALRATDPKALKADPDPVGPQNDQAIQDAVMRHDANRLEVGPIVCAWGVHGQLRGRGREVLKALLYLSDDVSCLGLTTGGYPRHPLYVPANAELQPLVIDERRTA